MKITTVILDIGKVLVEFDWKTYIKNLGFSEEINYELGETIFNNPKWKERDRGDKLESQYEEMFISMAPHLEKEIREIFKNIVNIVEVYPFATEWVQSIKQQGMKIYLLSNYSKTSFEHDKRKFEFMKYVDGGIISYEVNYVKPEKEIYKALIDKYGINPQEAVFLDDVKENIKMAQELGINTIHVTSHQEAVKELKYYGIN